MGLKSCLNNHRITQKGNLMASFDYVISPFPHFHFWKVTWPDYVSHQITEKGNLIPSCDYISNPSPFQLLESHMTCLHQPSKFPFLEFSHVTWLHKHPTHPFLLLENHITCLYKPSKLPKKEIWSHHIIM